MIVVHVAVTFETPAAVDRFLEVGRHVLPETRKEKGCVGYSYLRDAYDPRVLWSVEIWQDEAAMAAHMKAPHTSEILATLKASKIVAMTARRYDVSRMQDIPLS